MIPDGYTESLSLGGTTYVYRPFLHRERLAVLTIANSIECATGNRLASFYAHCLAPHLLAWDMGCEVSPQPLLRLWRDARGEWDRLLLAVLRPGAKAEEAADAKVLRRAAMLRATYPWLDRPEACGYCRTHSYDPLSNECGKIEEGRRPEGSKTLCEWGRGKCPLGHYDAPKVSSGRHRQALDFDAECRECGSWPDDPIVRRNARIISSAKRTVQHR